MPNTLEHERYRFQTMTERQLRTRLGRITDRRKLQNFVIVAREYGHHGLANEAERKLSPVRPLSEDLVRVTSTAPPEAHEPVKSIFTCSFCGDEIKPRSLIANFIGGTEVEFCSGLCRCKFLARREIEEKREGIRVIKIKKRE